MPGLVAPRQGKYSVSFKKRVVAEALTPGVRASAVARSHGLNPRMVCAWRRDPRFQPPEKKRKAIEAELAALHAEATSSEGDEDRHNAGFIAVEVAAHLRSDAASIWAAPDRPPGDDPSTSRPQPVSQVMKPVAPFPPAPMDVAGPAGRIELVLANGHRLLLSGNVDADAVLRLARGLAAQGAPS